MTITINLDTLVERAKHYKVSTPPEHPVHPKICDELTQAITELQEEVADAIKAHDIWEANCRRWQARAETAEKANADITFNLTTEITTLQSQLDAVEKERDEALDLNDGYHKAAREAHNAAIEEASKVVTSSRGYPWHYINGGTINAIADAIRELRQ
ncbi:hypothetical protein LCGC14_2523090 [marine sediment metagenome]|uniref:Ead/Ea22-like family protein n=1 Tax=marine sediment metagenome TaxID=412755 RepID=A0A0F9AWB7_9ZZZZ